jgi:hypothetical protein
MVGVGCRRLEGRFAGRSDLFLPLDQDRRAIRGLTGEPQPGACQEEQLNHNLITENSMLVRLLYASKAVDDVSQEELMTILSQSTAHNPASGITGALCSSGRLFLQLLEGGRMQVNALYNQIVADPRHKDVVILSYEEIRERRFANWSMGLVNLERVNASVLLKHSESAALDPYGVSGMASMALLDELMATASILGRADLLPSAAR